MSSRAGAYVSPAAAETGASAVQAADAATRAELVIVTIPQRAIPLLPEGILENENAAPGAPIVDTGNYYPARGRRRERHGDRTLDHEEQLPRLVALQVPKPHSAALRRFSCPQPGKADGVSQVAARWSGTAGRHRRADDSREAIPPATGFDRGAATCCSSRPDRGRVRPTSSA